MASNQPLGDDVPEPPRLRALRLLVTVLTATMIFGFLTIITLVVITMTQTPARLTLPENIALPVGETAEAFTQGKGWVALVTTDETGTERIRILDAASGTERQVIVIGSTPD